MRVDFSDFDERVRSVAPNHGDAATTRMVCGLTLAYCGMSPASASFKRGTSAAGSRVAPAPTGTRIVMLMTGFPSCTSHTHTPADAESISKIKVGPTFATHLLYRANYSSIAFILRTPADDASSLTILKVPLIAPVFSTCGPPQSSRL